MFKSGEIFAFDMFQTYCTVLLYGCMGVCVCVLVYVCVCVSVCVYLICSSKVNTL